MNKKLEMEIAHIVYGEYIHSKERQGYICCFTKKQIEELIWIYDKPYEQNEFVMRLKDSKPIGELQLYPVYITPSVMQKLLYDFVPNDKKSTQEGYYLFKKLLKY